MSEEKSASDDAYFGQLKKYAEDFKRVYESEKAQKEELRDAHNQLVKYAESLNDTIGQIKDKNIELREAYIDTIHRLVVAAEYKDEDTGDHLERMSRYSELIAKELGFSDEEVENILYAAPMHDVGKIGIPDNILMKPGKLTNDEFDVMKTHASIGAKILANSKAEILRLAHRIAISHHEKWNGKGYPLGHAGEKIPLEGRIIAIADTFDALTSKRPYKDPYPIDVAVDIIKKERGEHFDPDIADIFLKNIDRILDIKKEIDSDENWATEGFAWSERDSES